MMTMAGIRDALQSRSARRFQDFRLSDGTEFRVRSLTERERADFEASLFDGKGHVIKDRMLSARRRLVCMTLVDENNNPVYRVDEEHLLGDLDGGLVEELYQAAQKVCGLKDADVETVAKKSAAIRVAD
jgi:hypothetical protein